MAKFVVDYGNLGKPPPDGRLDAPTFHRNHEFIWSVMADKLDARTGDVLEIGSGTGQHIVAFAQRAPNLVWWPSDIYPSHLASIEAWRSHARLANLRAPQRIDLLQPDWTWRDGARTSGRLTAIVSVNVLHISPWAVSESLIAGAGRLLDAGGWLFVYGPFMRDGTHTAPSNAEFDASLRAQNPQWGVRDVRDLRALADMHDLALAEEAPMPANNLVLAFVRGAGKA